MPEVKTDLEQLLILNSAHLCQICEALKSLLSQHLGRLIRFDYICKLLDKVDIVLEDGRDSDG